MLGSCYSIGSFWESLKCGDKDGLAISVRGASITRSRLALVVLIAPLQCHGGSRGAKHASNARHRSLTSFARRAQPRWHTCRTSAELAREIAFGSRTRAL